MATSSPVSVKARSVRPGAMSQAATPAAAMTTKIGTSARTPTQPALMAKVP